MLGRKDYTDSLINNDGVLRGNDVVKFGPGTSILKLGIGDRIRLTGAQFERLAHAYLAEIKPDSFSFIANKALDAV